MFGSILLVSMIFLTSSKAISIDTHIPNIKPNYFDPILSSKLYTGHVKENERVVQVEPSLSALDADSTNSANGQICGYELSSFKHDDSTDQTSQNIPFVVELIDGKAVIKVKDQFNKLDCEVKGSYRLFVRAYDCANFTQRRYSERSSLIIAVDDVNEFAPIFTHEKYLFKLYQDQNCLSCRVEATDDDCGNVDQGVCDYQIRTPNVPFSIDSNGSISITQPLTNTHYEFDVVAIDCYPSSPDDSRKKMSEPAKVTIKIIQSCKPTITDNNPTKLTIQSDHTHLFEAVHVDTCDETCAVESIFGSVTLDNNGIDSGCNTEQCSTINHEYILIPKDTDYNQAPQTLFMSFDGFKQSLIIDKSDLPGKINNDFTIRMWMKHGIQEEGEKQHIFCKSDEKLRNRHHTALFVEGDQLKLLIRKGPLSTNGKTYYASQWEWKLSQVNDNQWHSYKLFVNYPNKIDLYVDDEYIVQTEENFNIIEDFALPIIEGTGETVFAVGACWHARALHMAQYLQGQLSGLSIEQKEDLPKSVSCTQDCLQYLEMPDMQVQTGMEFFSNPNRSMWTLRTDSSELYEHLLKHVIYRNTFDPIGPSGQRTITIQTSLKCMGENYTYNLPAFSRRVVIEEIIHTANTLDLKGDTDFFVPEDVINQGIFLYGNVSISTDAGKREQVDISDCSINTSPELTPNEQIIVPDDNLDVNNLQKDVTKTGLILSGLGSLDAYQDILRNIVYTSKSPIQYYSRTFSLVCVGTHEQISTNEIRVQVHIEKHIPEPDSNAAVLSNKLFVDNDQMRDNLFDIDDTARSVKYVSGWPLVVVVCVSIGLASILVLYLVVRIRSGNRQRGPLSGTADDGHSQMEWEDDIGLNIIVNPLETTKKPAVQSINPHNMKQTVHKYEGASSDDEDCMDHSQSEYSSGEEDDDDEDDVDYEDDENNQIHAKKGDHQLEWDDEALEYGPKQV